MDKTRFNDSVLPQNDFLRLVGAPNESIRLILIYYMFKYSFGIRTVLPESVRIKQSPLKVGFEKTSYNDFVSDQSDLLRLFRALNESLRLIKLYNMFKYSYGIKNILLELLRSQKSPLNALFQKR